MGLAFGVMARIMSGTSPAGGLDLTPASWQVAGRVQVVAPLSPMWETEVAFLALSLGLTQTCVVGAFGE